MPFVRFLVFKYTAYCFKLVAVILLLSEIIPTYFYYAEKGLVCVIIIVLLGRQPSSYVECTKLNICSSCNIRLVFNVKCIFFTRFYTL